MEQIGECPQTGRTGKEPSPKKMALTDKSVKEESLVDNYQIEDELVIEEIYIDSICGVY